MTHEEIDEDFDFFMNLKKKNSLYNKVKSDFTSVMDAKIQNLNLSIKELVSGNDVLLIVEQMKTIDHRTSNEQQTARIQFILNHISDNGVKIYRDWLNETFPLSEVENRMDEIMKEVTILRKDNPRAQVSIETKKEVEILNAYKAKLISVHNTINDLIDDGIYGDLSLNDKDLPAVKFVFKKLDDVYVKCFIKEIMNIKSDAIKKVRKVTCYNDVTNSTAYVLFFFENDADRMTFYSSKSMLDGVYDKYIRNSQGINGEYNWDLLENKLAYFVNANLPITDPLSGLYQDPNKPLIPESPSPSVLDDEDNESDDIADDELDDYVDSKDENDDLLILLPNEVVFGVKIDEDDVSFKIISKHLFLNQSIYDDRDIFVDILDNNVEWSQIDNREWSFKDGDATSFKEGFNYLKNAGMKYESDLDKLEGLDTQDLVLIQTFLDSNK